MVTIRPVASRTGPVIFSQKPPRPVDITKSMGMIIRKRLAKARRGQPLESWLEMGFTITPQATKVKTTEAVEVPDNVAEDLAAMWDYFSKNPGFVAHVKFDKKDETGPFLAQARSWAAAQKVKNADGNEGALIFRQLPAKGLPDTELRFSLSAQPTKAEAAAREADKKRRADKKAAAAAAAASDAK